MNTEVKEVKTVASVINTFVEKFEASKNEPTISLVGLRSIQIFSAGLMGAGGAVSITAIIPTIMSGGALTPVAIGGFIATGVGIIGFLGTTLIIWLIPKGEPKVTDTMKTELANEINELINTGYNKEGLNEEIKNLLQKIETANSTLEDLNKKISTKNENKIDKDVYDKDINKKASEISTLNKEIVELKKTIEDIKKTSNKTSQLVLNTKVTDEKDIKIQEQGKEIEKLNNSIKNLELNLKKIKIEFNTLLNCLSKAEIDGIIDTDIPKIMQDNKNDKNKKALYDQITIYLTNKKVD